MTTYATNNPIGSMDPKDLFDNAQNLDFALNDITKAIWKDRFGKDRQTFWGMEQRFSQFIQSSGYKVLGDYTSGPLTITDYNQLIRYENEFWKLNATTNIPYTTTGNDSASWALDSSNFLTVGDASLRQELSSPGGAGLVGDIPKPITWTGFAGGAKGDETSNAAAITAANNSAKAYSEPEGYWPNDIDSTFNVYPGYRNNSGGLKVKRGLPGAGAENPFPLIWAEKTSKMKRVDGGTKWFDVAMQGLVTLESEASAFGVGVSGHVRTSAGDVLTSGKSVDAIGVHGSGKAIGRNGRVWGFWGQAGNGDDGSGVRSSQLVGCELNVVNLFSSQPHPENLPTGEGPYRGLIITTADGGSACGIGIDVGDGSGLAAGASGWWFGMRLRRNGVLPSGDWRNNYLEDTHQLKIEGSISNTSRYGGIRFGGRLDGQGKNFTYGINLLDASIQDANAINLAADHRIYWGPVVGTVKWIGYEDSTGAFNIRNMNLSINSNKVLGPRITGIFAMTGTADGTAKNTETVTLQELARHHKKVTDALIAHGLISPT
ncbi:hypothetical protein [Enterobacter roggenkampii]|uniref:hypothetical protein n=1 Tax=Enterobacter roggenkampii TaxID=1812935 RepID=UPI001C70A251|nr:hypothetical protein [Enterobacter roggenkampii]MBW9438424.1 hypothetical protein [Enterobacter roggenkampii]